jgi:Bacterial Ig-like domain
MNAFKLLACATVLTAIFASCSNDKTLTEPDKATITKPADKSATQPGSSDAAGNLQAQNLTLSIDPANGSVGVPRDQSTVKVTFDEPMYRLGTEAAIAISGTVQGPPLVTRDLKTAATFAWNADDTVVTVTLGTSLLDREQVRVSVPRGTPTQRPSSSASGHVGTLRGKSASFRAAKGAIANLYAQAQGCVDSNHAVEPSLNFTYSGDNFDNSFRRCFYGFDLSSLPAGVLRILPYSGFYLNQTGIYGDPSQLGAELVERVNYGFAIDGADFDLAPLTTATSITPAAITPGAASAPISDAISSAMAANSSQLHLRVRFTNGSYNNGTWDGYTYTGIDGLTDVGKPQLQVVYDMP